MSNTLLNLELKLENSNNYISKDTILKNIISLYNLNSELITFLNNHDITGFESDIIIGTNSENNNNSQGTNPLLWELGHICYFYEYHFFNNLEDNYSFFISDGNLYDSFLTNRKYRFEFRPHSKKIILEYFEFIFKNLVKKLYENEFTKKISYLFFLSLLHNHMHCESFIFTQKLLTIKNSIYKKINYPNYDINFDYVKVTGGKFKQGTYEGENLISFDNEMPQFETRVEDFYISKYCVTENLVKQFILNDGYKNNKYWSINGWRWVQENEIEFPFYWIKKGNDYFINDNELIRETKMNLPATHISWYEAEAICNWLGGRLPTETEWEYIATNGGITKYPWGNIDLNKMNKKVCNLNYSGNICPVDFFLEGNNKNEIVQLFGNVWEWCQESIYPYDGFKIDPVYKEFSYPFFGFKKVLRGGSWATPDILINSRYRNAQMPDCRIQFTGFRVVKKNN